MMSSSSTPHQALSADVAAICPEIPFKTGHEVREAFLTFFERKLAHRRMPSASLVPQNNPTVLLTPAGMLPFVPIFMGLEPIPTPPRATSSQKCARVSGKASDLRAVGRTPCHHTFFEMLGNFSFGDYFKEEVIPWAWEFITEVLQLPKERLWVTVHHSDDEAALIWENKVGIAPERILRRGDKDNFWGPPGPTGPCGPCTEIYFDTLRPDRICPGCQTGDTSCQTPSPTTGCHPDQCEAVDCRRYMEIWNLVFMQFFKDEAGTLTPLENKNVDTGMGLERITMVVQDKNNTFETDLLSGLVAKVASLAGYTASTSSQEAPAVACRIIADHIRFMGFAIADGVMPSNEGRGYILRMMIRRAFLQAYQWLSLKTPFLAQLLDTLIDEYGTAYPELVQAHHRIAQILTKEELRFLETLERGMGLLSEWVAHPETYFDGKVLHGQAAFKLYDTYGFPMDLTLDVLESQGYSVEVEGYEKALQEAKTLSRANRKNTMIVSDTLYSDIFKEVGSSVFTGYDTLTSTVTVQALIVEGELVGSVHGTNTVFECILNQTPFYPEGGGQVGDQGSLVQEEGPQGLTALVLDTYKRGDLIVHRCKFDQGEHPLSVGTTLTAYVEPFYRERSAIHHSATHLVNAALRKVLDPQQEGLIQQAGSYVSPTGARFDFTFERGLTQDELNRVEFLANKWVRENYPREVVDMPLEEAKASGAVATFDEKYGESVRVVRYGDASLELCGGTHTTELGRIGPIKLLSECSIAAGIRRVEFVVGELAYKLTKQDQMLLQRCATLLNVPSKELEGKLGTLLETQKNLEKHVLHLQVKLHEGVLQGWVNTILNAPTTPHVVGTLLEDTPSEILKKLAETFSSKTHHTKSILLLGSLNTETQAAQFVGVVSPSLVEAGFKAGDLVKTLASACGGGGGGKPTLAMAGGKQGEHAHRALDELKFTLAQTLKG
ncbi:MAG: alanine--tRNA ligase [Vampirovibrionales bacterium]